MKKIKSLCCLILAIGTLSGCFRDASSVKIDYLPAKADGDDDWGFVNSKGEFSCEDQFAETPSAVIEGVFSVRENDAYSLYEYDSKKPKLIFEDLASVGVPSDGILPLTRKECRIEIVKTDGKVLYELSKIDGKTVVSCRPRFEDGNLTVYVVSDDGTKMSCLIDKKGKTMIKPFKGDLFRVCKDIYAMVTKDYTEIQFVNANGEKLPKWKTDTAIEGVFGEYIVVRKNDRCYIYDSQGEELLKCSDKVKGIKDIENGFFVYENSGYGVMDFNGEKIVSNKYSNIIITDKGFLVQKNEDREYEFLNKKGESEYTVDYKIIRKIPGFGLVASDGQDYVILNSRFEPAGKTELSDINVEAGQVHGCVESDFFDYEGIVSSTSSIIDKELHNKGFVIGNNPNKVSSILDKSTDEFHYESNYSEQLISGNKYKISAKVSFDDYIVTPKYEEKAVQKYNYWTGGYYYDTERELAGYVFNDNAKINAIVLEIEVPSSKTDKVLHKLQDAFSSKFNKQDEYTYTNDNQSFTISETYSGVNVKISAKGTADYPTAEVVAVDTTVAAPW